MGLEDPRQQLRSVAKHRQKPAKRLAVVGRWFAMRVGIWRRRLTTAHRQSALGLGRANGLGPLARLRAGFGRLAKVWWRELQLVALIKQQLHAGLATGVADLRWP